MDKLKKIFSPGHDKDDEVMYDPPGSSQPEHSESASGRLAGEGSHFGSKRSEEPGTSGMTEASTTGTHPSDMLNKADPRVDAELKGTGVDATRGATGRTGEAAVGQTSTYGSYSVGPGDRTSGTIDPSSEDPRTFQRPEKAYLDSGSGVGSGNAFGHGGSDIAPRESTDPVPASSDFGSDTRSFHPHIGRDAGMASSAAGLAWNKHNRSGSTSEKGVPGGFPKEDYENPYKATNLDPRVDSIPRRTANASSASTSQFRGPPSDSTSAAAGVASLGGVDSLAHPERRAPESAGPKTRAEAGSSLTSTTNPVTRPPEYNTAAETKVPDTTSSATTVPDPVTWSTSSTTQPAEATSGRFSGMLGGAAAALGFGGAQPGDHGLNAGASNPATIGTAAGGQGTASGQHTSFYHAATAAAPKDHGQPSTMTQDQPSVTRGTAESSIPFRSGPPPSHHRKESIPTTPYPSGTLDSPAASAPPRGPSRDEAVFDRTNKHHYRRDEGPAAEDTSRDRSPSYEPVHEKTIGRSGMQDFRSSASPSGPSEGLEATGVKAPERGTIGNEGAPSRVDHPEGGKPTPIPTFSSSLGGPEGMEKRHLNEGRSKPEPGNKIPSAVTGITGSSSQELPQRSYGPIADVGGRSTRDTPEETRDEHHHGHDAAMGAGAAGAGVGAYEIGKDRHRDASPVERTEPTFTPASAGWTGAAESEGSRLKDFSVTQPPASEDTTLQPGQYDRPSGVGETPPAGVPTSKSDTTGYDGLREDRQNGRDATAAGIGASAIGPGLHEYEKHQGAERRYNGSSQPLTPNQYDPPRGPPPSAVTAPTTRDERSHEYHGARDTALGGAAVVGAGAAGYEYSQHQDAAERQRLAERQQAIEEHQRKEGERQAKEDQEAAEKAEKKHQHEIEKQKEQEEKAAAKEEKHRQHELEKQKEREEKLHEKEVARMRAETHARGNADEEAAAAESEQSGNKKGSIFGFLNRRKNKDTGEDEEYTEEGEGVGLTGASVAPAYESDHHHNKLHKDPPADHPAAAARESTSMIARAGAGTPAYHDAPVREDGHAGATTITGGSTMQDVPRGSTQYAEPPRHGYASQVTGGTGSTALAQGEPGPRGSHATTAGNIADFKLGPEDTAATGSIEGRAKDVRHNRGTYEDNSQGPLTHGSHTLHPGHPDPRSSDKSERNRSIEPITGLPVDLSKGTGEGGTDDGPIPSLKDRLFGHH